MTTPGEYASPVCAGTRLSAFKMRLCLQLRLNGTGLVGVEAVGAADFTASVVAYANEGPVLLAHISGAVSVATSRQRAPVERAHR